MALVPVDVYLRLTGKPRCEYRDGVLYPRAMPTKLHSIIQRVLMTLLQNQGIPPFPELTLCISATKYLIPDVAVANSFRDLTLRKPCGCVANRLARRPPGDDARQVRGISSMGRPVLLGD